MSSISRLGRLHRVSGTTGAASRNSHARIATAMLPAAALLLYCSVIVSRGPGLSAARFLDSDAPGAAYLGTTLFSGGTTLPVHSEIGPTLLEGGPMALPGGHALVALLGPAFGLLTVMALAWAVRRLGGSGMLVIAAGMAAGPIVLGSELFPTAHAFTLLAAAALSAALVVSVGSATAPRLLLAGAGVLSGVALAGDQGFIAMGVLPLLAATCALWLRDRGGAAFLRPALVAAVAVAAAVAAVVLLRVAGVAMTGSALFGSAGTGRIPLGAGVALAARTFGWMASGANFGSAAGQPWDTLVALAGCAVPLVAPAALWRALRHGGLPTIERTQLAYLTFWVTVDVAVLASFLALGYAQSIVSGRYLIPCLLSAVATLPLLVRGSRRAALTALVAAYVVVQAVGVLGLDPRTLAGTLAPRDAASVLAALRGHGLTHGIAGYSDSAALTWLSGDEIRIVPATTSGCAAGMLCATAYSSSTWYQPAPGASFVVVRRSSQCLSSAPALLGTPSATISVNADVTVLVYAHDVAAHVDTHTRVLCP